MRHGRTLLSALVVAGTALFALSPLHAGTAAAETPQLTGLWLTTDYPERNADFGDAIRIGLDLMNKNLPPQRVELSVDGLPDGWKSEIDGGGAAIEAAMVGTDRTVSLDLHLTPPKTAKAGTYAFEVEGKVVGQGEGRTMTLPVKLTLAAPKPAKLTLDPKLPDLRGTAKSSFDFELTLKNESLNDTVVNLAAAAPDGFEVAFTEGYGSQEITSLPVKAGASKTVHAKVHPPQNVAAGHYQVQVGAQSDVAKASANLELDVTGQPAVALEGPNGMLSGSATAGEERDFTFTVANSGSAPAHDLSLRADAPSGWKVKVDPKTLPELQPDQQQKVTVEVTPGDKAVAGDYMMSVRANGKGVSNSADFRITVMTSTMWGIIGVVVILIALMVLAVGVRRYGRR
ncbi:Uncharacterized membrane protein [Tistlia consotensis]|uniref:Uncharacterized membrane protein n=1 Tax=Tistlia consotensis USBA 355 TaxID=560819 RepID=A0A1Y6CM33_9PROT|nr:NEW3 domain-containing protein [Tistlia consotensis]SMF77008.1 Uncharacterized membrane protein [Tistlia consotensis USBA 355]SNS13810.1 Uncharacterized membrane protein [Tistlia consotensis]